MLLPAGSKEAERIGMPCPHCGASTKPTSVYCPKCGSRLAKATTGPARRATRPLLADDFAPEDPIPPDQQATQPVAPLSADGLPSTLDQLAAAETREFMPSAMAAPAAPGTVIAPGTMIGEHFRVIRLVEVTPDGPLYEVADLWATEQCWACGVLWQDGDDEHFCNACGAERRGKAVLMRQQPLDIAILQDAATIAPNVIIDHNHLFIIVGGNDPPPPPLAPAIPAEHAPEPSTAAMPAATATRMQLDDRLGVSEPPTLEAPYFEATTLLEGAAQLLEIRLGIASDVGMTRQGRANEDSSVVMTLRHAGDQAPPPLTLAVVADGLGGHEDGRRAGRLAARIIARHVLQQLWIPALAGEATPLNDPVSLGGTLRAAIHEANAHILKLNRQENNDMGCTVTAFIAQGDAACIANVGDSRTYRFDNHDLARVTTDHSLVARLVAAGMLAPEDVYTHPQRSQIYRSLGDEPDVPVDLFPCRLRAGETFVLCSDGLWEMARDPQIGRALLHTALGDPQALAQRLVDLANENGGEDNITVIVAQVMG
jgi:serine/threonine protein phosphatase PrpC